MSLVRRGFDEALLAMVLLTRLPVGRLIRAPSPPLRDAVWAFPLAGIVVGGAAVLVRVAGLRLGMPPVVAAIWALGAMVALTGGLHEDAVADTADALGGATVERRLAIMRDSRIGSFGATALLLSVGMRGAAMISLPAAGVIASVMCARVVMGGVLAVLPPARPDGLGAAAGHASFTRAGVGAAIAVGVSLVLLPPGRALACLGAAACGAAALGWVAWRRFGGQTGDLCGAAGMAAEVLAMSVLAGS